LLNLLNRPTQGVAALQKPDKVYLENTNFSYALKETPEIGTLRETFLLNQLKNAGLTVQLSPKADFLVNGTYHMEVGGKNKSAAQVAGVDNAFIVADDIESGMGKTIPLWLFGFLY